jgi:hypothetical protein
VPAHRLRPVTRNNRGRHRPDSNQTSGHRMLEQFADPWLVGTISCVARATQLRHDEMPHSSGYSLMMGISMADGRCKGTDTEESLESRSRRRIVNRDWKRETNL